MQDTQQQKASESTPNTFAPFALAILLLGMAAGGVYVANSDRMQNVLRFSSGQTGVSNAPNVVTAIPSTPLTSDYSSSYEPTSDYGMHRCQDMAFGRDFIFALEGHATGFSSKCEYKPTPRPTAGSAY